MVWQRMIQRLKRRNRRRSSHTTQRSRRSLHHELLDRRELLASDIGAISGIAFTDLTGNGISGDDPRLSGLTVELFLDSNDDDMFDNGDASQGTTTTAGGGAPEPGAYRFDDLAVGTYFVVQQTQSGSATQPAPQMVEITADDADGETIVTIDDFTTGSQLLTATAGNDQVESVSAPGTLGGERDVQLEITNGAGNSTFQVDTAGTGLLSLGTAGDATARATVEYDGTDGAFGLNVPPGFTPITSLAGGTAGDAPGTNTGLQLLGRAENQAETMIVTVYSSGTSASEVPVTIPQDVATLQDIFVAFSDPSWVQSTAAGVTSPADFNSIIGIVAEAEVTLINNDIFFSVVESRGPAPVSVDLNNVQTLSLGGTVFQDFGVGADANDGMLDAGETRLAGVEVQLFDEPAGGGTIDPTQQTAFATTTTDGNGDYVFTGLDAGNYVVAILDAEFAMGEPLFGHSTSTGNDPAPDPDDNVDDDDNGTAVENFGLVSGEITLVINSEPTDDGDNDSNTNLTVDFGVVPNIDLAITKTLDEANSTLAAGGQAFFDIAFQNNGPLDATNVVITDVIPAGLTINLANSDFGTFTETINGQNVSVAIGSLAATATGSIRIAVDIAGNQTVDLTNTATIAGDQVETDTANNSDDALVTLERTDLSITKSDNTAGSVTAGEQFTYTITVTNAGPDTATGIVATDILPDDLSFVSASFTTGTGSVTENPGGSGDLTINIDDLAQNASAVIDVVVLVAANAGDTLMNTATVTSTPNTDTDTTNNSATETTPVARNVDVAVTKTTAGTPTAGAQITYTFTVTNNGPGIARGVTVVDTLDNRLTFNALTAGATGVTVTENGQQLTFDVPDIDANSSLVFSFTVDIATSATGTVNNAATVSTTDNDTNAANDTSDVDIAVVVDTDLVLDKAVDLTTAVPGNDTLTYTFTISHDADSVSDSGQVTFTDQLPAGVTGLTISAPDALSSGFDTTQQTVNVVYAPIPIGEDRTFTVTASVNDDATGTIDNTGSISVAGGDSDTTNNSDTVSTTLTPEFDVTLTKSADDTTPAPASNVTYTIALTNAGPSTATGVVLTDDVPAGMTFVSGTLEGNAATLSGNTVTFPSITLDDDETVNATLVFTVGADASGTITNTATVAADAGEVDATNNTATEDITAEPQADLTVAKTVDRNTVQSGETLTYTVTVTNSGVSTAVAATASDTLPSGVTFVSGVGPNSEALTATNGVITVNGGDLAPNTSFQFTIIATVNDNASGTLTNNVSVTTTTNESDATNNAASAISTVDPFQSSISGFAYLDPDNDGDFSADEVGLAGFLITLTGTDSDGNAIEPRSVVTDESGFYQFLQLPAGTYRVEQTQLEDFVDGQTTVGANATATATDNVFSDLDLDFSTNATDFNFGELRAILSKRRFLASS
ncbi:MAG: SdrD B-like domain-containing protein [Planctomycetota bacterium]